jgi:hypothetical protein
MSQQCYAYMLALNNVRQLSLCAAVLLLIAAALLVYALAKFCISVDIIELCYLAIYALRRTCMDVDWWPSQHKMKITVR